MPLLTHQRLRQVLRYIKSTGLFWWVERAPGRRLDRPAGDGTTYRWLTIDGERLLAHRVAWFYVTGAWPEHEVDHRNRLKSDNRWRNLREATHKQNAENCVVRKHSKSQVKGVYWSASRQRWHAYIDHNKKRHHLGRHTTLRAAKAARHAAEERLFTHA